VDNKFNQKDKEKFIEFLNFVAKHAKFELTTTEVIEYYKTLSHMQQVVLKKIESNVFEIQRVIESKDKRETE
jgi:hypothetical protein